jgi:hypothetical protein
MATHHDKVHFVASIEHAVGVDRSRVRVVDGN